MIPKSVYPRAPWWSFVFDLALVLAFVLIGRRSHDESNALVGIATTAWPFVTGLVIGWLFVIGFRWPFVTVYSGAIIWIATVVGGMLLRNVSDQGVATSFVIVALIVNAVFLIGWRALAIVLKKRSAARA